MAGRGGAGRDGAGHLDEQRQLALALRDRGAGHDEDAARSDGGACELRDRRQRLPMRDLHIITYRIPGAQHQDAYEHAYCFSNLIYRPMHQATSDRGREAGHDRTRVREDDDEAKCVAIGEAPSMPQATQHIAGGTAGAVAHTTRGNRNQTPHAERQSDSRRSTQGAAALTLNPNPAAQRPPAGVCFGGWQNIVQ